MNGRYPQFDRLVQWEYLWAAIGGPLFIGLLWAVIWLWLR